MKNNYGNYVVQKALNLSHQDQKNRLISSIVKNIEKIGDRKLILKWQSIIGSHLDFNINCMANVNRNKKPFNTVVIDYDRSNMIPMELVRGNNRFNTELRGYIVNNNEYMKK